MQLDATETLTEKLITADQLAEILGVSRRRVWDLATAKKIPAIKLGASWRFRLSSVMETLEKGSENGKEK
jgi:excisionase family DNA binding protein